MHDLTPHWCQRTEYWTVLSACPDMELGEKKRVRLRSIKKGKKKKGVRFFTIKLVGQISASQLPQFVI